MQTYLIKVWIRDDEHEYLDCALLNAEDQIEADRLALESCDKDDEFWGYGDHSTSVALREVSRLTPTEKQVLHTLGVANFIN